MPIVAPANPLRCSSAAHRALAWLCASLAVVLTGCPSVDGDTDPEPLPAEVASYPVYVAAYATADCERDLRCDDKPKHATVQACVDAIDPDTKLARERIGASVAAGKTAYDPTFARDCLAIIRGPCSTDFLSILKVCNEVITGLVPIDGKCIAHFECAEPAGHTGLGPYCFEGCKGLFGSEDPIGAGTCVLKSPVNDPPCK